MDKEETQKERGERLLKKWSKILDFTTGVPPLSARRNTCILVEAQETWLQKDDSKTEN